MFVSYAQNAEDVVLHRLFATLDSGYYVDVGAMDPEQDSVTKAFYDRGWSGINIEPNPLGAAKLRAVRTRDYNLDCVLGSAPGTTTFYAVHGAGAGLSTTRREVAKAAVARGGEVTEHRRSVRRLRDVLREAGATTIHFLKIDVEGAERDVLAGMDFAQWRPWVVLVEAVTAGVSVADRRGTHQQWEPLLLDSDYLFALDDGVNRWYVASEHAPELLESCSFPASVLDNWISSRQLVLWQQLDEVTRALTMTTAALKTMQDQNVQLQHALSLVQATTAQRREVSAAVAQGPVGDV